jgi:hypothetical protein
MERVGLTENIGREMIGCTVAILFVKSVAAV